MFSVSVSLKTEKSNTKYLATTFKITALRARNTATKIYGIY